MMRATLLVSAALLACSVAARAQTPGPPAPASRLDLIEQKLDEVLRRLDQPLSPHAGTVQGPAGAIPSRAPTLTPTASPEAHKPGALAIIRAASHDPNGLATIPADSVGGFVYAAAGSASPTSTRTASATSVSSARKSRAGCV